MPMRTGHSRIVTCAAEAVLVDGTRSTGYHERRGRMPGWSHATASMTALPVVPTSLT